MKEDGKELPYTFCRRKTFDSLKTSGLDLIPESERIGIYQTHMSAHEAYRSSSLSPFPQLSSPSSWMLPVFFNSCLPVVFWYWFTYPFFFALQQMDGSSTSYPCQEPHGMCPQQTFDQAQVTWRSIRAIGRLWRGFTFRQNATIRTAHQRCAGLQLTEEERDANRD